MENNISLVCFADSQYRKALKRLKEQAIKSKFFNNVYIYTEKNLDISFKLKHRKILNHGTRGYGFWIWKPQIIIQCMLNSKENDILIYMDAGFHINKRGKKIFEEYISKVRRSESGLLFIDTRKSDHNCSSDRRYPSYSNLEYTKRDLLDSFGIAEKNKFKNANQFMTGLMIIRVTKLNIEIMKSWLSVSESNNYAYINDSVSINGELDGFKEHRHDMSVLNCVVDAYSVNPVIVSYYDTWPGYPKDDGPLSWEDLDYSPFQARRDTQRFFVDKVKTKIKKNLIKYKLLRYFKGRFRV